MKKRILSLVLILSLALNCGLVAVQAAGLDPYIGFSATAIDDYKCERTSFTTYKRLGGIWAGDWACYKGLDFGETSPYAVDVAVGVPEGYSKAVELRIDAPDGVRIATVPITPSGAFATPVVCKAELEKKVTGVHDLYITNANSTSDIYEIKFYKPREAGEDIPQFDNSDAYTDIADDLNKREINILYQLGLLRDYDGDSFDPKMPVTRGEFIYSVFKLYGIEDAKEAAFETQFTDVNPEKYYAQAIAFLTDAGIVNGVTADTFRPDDFICYVDALAIICRVLDYDSMAQARGGYPLGYIRVATEEKFYLSDIGTYDYLRRTDMARLIYNSIDATGLVLTGIEGDNSVYREIEGLLYKTQKMYTGYGIINTNYLSNLYIPETDVDKTAVVINNEIFKTGKTNAVAMLGMDCEFYYTIDDGGTKTLAAIAPMSKTTITKLSSQTDDIEVISDEKIVYYNEKGREVSFKIDKDTAVLYNGIAIDDSVENTVISADDFCGTITLIENGRNKANTVMIDEYVNYVVGSVDTIEEFFVDYNVDTKVDLSKDNAAVFIKKLDEVITVADLIEGDVVSVFASKNKTGAKYIRVYVNAEEISGKISTYNAAKEMVYINGIEYKVSPWCTSRLEVGQSGIFKLDVNGYITDYEKGDTSERMIGLYLAGALEDAPINPGAIVRLFTSSGKAEAFELAKKVKIDGIWISDGNSAINGSGEWAGLSALTEEKPLVYSVNNDNQIVWMDTLLKGDEGKDDTFKQLTKGDSVIHNYQGGIMAVNVKDSSNVSYSIGRYFVPTSATMITYFENARSNEENWAMSKIGNSIADTAYPVGEVYSTFGDDYSGDVFVWRNRHTSTSYGIPFVFTGMTTSLDENGNIVYSVEGIDGRAKVSYLLTSDTYESGVLKDALPGDVVRVKLNSEKEIFAAEYIAFREGTAVRNSASATVSADARLSTGTNRDVRFLYGKIAQKADDYLALDLGTLIIDGTTENVVELIERSSAAVVIVNEDGRYGEYSFDYGLTAQNVMADDTVLVYLNDGATKLIVVYKDVTL